MAVKEISTHWGPIKFLLGNVGSFIFTRSQIMRPLGRPSPLRTASAMETRPALVGNG
jgi:hypothetical protein